MNNLNSVLCASLVLLSGLTFGQSTRKLLKINAKADFVSYGDSSVYSRGLYNDSSRVYLGNSNGALYLVDLTKRKSQLLFKLPDFTEMRDVERSVDFILGISSGDIGKMIRISMSGDMKVIQHPEWKNVFIDAIDFRGNHGFMLGDPVDGKFTLFHSFDKGLTWTRCEGEVSASPEEAAFAASGTNAHILNDSTYVFISGGMVSRFIKSTDSGKTWSTAVLPYYPGKSTGPYSLCFANDSVGVMVGGDYKDPDIQMNTTFFTQDGGESWMNAMTPPKGYRSCVVYANGVFYCCGTNGIDYSINGGSDWSPFAEGNFFTLGSYKDRLIATSTKGRIYEFQLIQPEE